MATPAGELIPMALPEQLPTRSTAHRRAPRSSRSFAAVALVAVLLAGSWAGLSAYHPIGSVPSSSPSPPSVRVSPSPAAPSAAAREAPGAGCRAGTEAEASAATPAAPHPASVLYNSQVAPDAVVTGPYAYVAGGAAIRDQGYGEIDLSWPGGTTSNLVAAYMVWSILNNTVPPAWGTVNGHNVTGTWTAYATPSPCWSPTYIYTFFADVTPYVVNGENVLTAFPSGVTSGESPWLVGQIDPMDEGVSLVAIYNAGTSTTQQITVYTGAETTEGQLLSEQLNYSTTNSASATTTYIVADGQLPGNEAFWNDSLVDSDAFPGGDPKETTQSWSYGNLSDTVTFSVPVVVGSNNTTAQAEPTDGDCFTWVGQVLSVGVPAVKGPYPVTFSEQGLPAETKWSVTANDTLVSNTTNAAGGSVVFSLGNGTYPYAVTPLPGYTALYSGTVVVDGGSDYVRVAFHAILYPLNVTETGLPEDAEWWVHVTNTTLSVSENLSISYRDYLPFNLSNGTYVLTDGSDGLYLSDSPSLTVTISGSPLTVPITFRPPPLFDVTFLEHGLRAGTTWGGTVETNFGEYAPITSTNSTIVPLPNASAVTDVIYPDSVLDYSVVSYIYFGVPGAPVTVDVNYTPLYDVNFTETGLVGSILWSAILSGGSIYLTGSEYSSPIQLHAPNGSYSFTIPAVFAYTASVSSGTVVVDGANVTVAITFSAAATFSLTFTEVGLTSGTAWTISLGLPNDTTVELKSTTSTIVFDEANGSFTYTVGAVRGYVAAPDYGDEEIDGAPIAVTITYNTTYTVTFQEVGLPTGIGWDGYLVDAYNYSVGTFLNFTVPNGSYEFAFYDAYVYEVGAYFAPDPATGTAIVAGASIEITINYSYPEDPTYTVEFSESGAPTGAEWSVTLYNGEADVGVASTGLDLNFTELDGTFTYTVYAPSGYTPDPASGSGSVDGANQSIAIVFTKTIAQFDVTFEETGLPEDTSWHATLNGSLETESTSEISFNEPNGTYDFSVSASGYKADPASGSVTVVGEAVTESIVFTAIPATTFAVTFDESGLPDDTEWMVTLNGTPATESSSSIVFDEPNGTYDFSVSASGFKAAPASGSVIVAGEAVTESIEFSAAPLTTYAVTFDESGLPSGTAWWVNVTGAPSGSSTTDSYVADLPNGTYDFTFQTGDHFYLGGASYFEVVGGPTEVPVDFSLVEYTVTFTETGLPAGTTWWVNVTGGPSLEGDTASVTVSLPNGTFAFTASSLDSSLRANGGHDTVQGSPLSVSIVFGSSSASSSPTFLGLPGAGGYIALGAFVALFALLFLFLLTRRRKRKDDEAGPATPPPGAAPPPPGA